jgi:uncharacterized membrane protein
MMQSAKFFPTSKDKIIYTGQIFFSLGVIGIGIQQFIYNNFLPVILPRWPAWIPLHFLWAYLVGAIFITAGLLIILKKQPRITATRLGMFFLLFFVFTVIIQLTHNYIADLLNFGVWTNTLKEFAFCGSAFVVAVSLPVNRLQTDYEPSFIEKFENKLLPFGKYSLAIMVFIFGIDHFIYTDYVATLVPSWIPGHIFWTYFAGAALIAAGAGIILNIKARLAATMLGVMLFIWVIILHIPRAIVDPSDNMGNETTSVFEALAFCGVAFIMGQILPGKDKIK